METSRFALRHSPVYEQVVLLLSRLWGDKGALSISFLLQGPLILPRLLGSILAIHRHP